jgi:methylphosphotriester-DNA--protein-cysteine methyltransferase
MIYHWPGCPNYDDVSAANRVEFGSRAEAERAGYRAARNCR